MHNARLDIPPGATSSSRPYPTNPTLPASHPHPTAPGSVPSPKGRSVKCCSELKSTMATASFSTDSPNTRLKSRGGTSTSASTASVATGSIELMALP